MSSGPLLDRLDALLERGERMSSFQFPEKEGSVFGLGASNRARLSDWKDGCFDLIRDAMGKESELYRAFPVDYPDHRQGTFHVAMDHYLFILRLLRERMDETPREEPEAEAAAPSIVEGARRLLKAGYKDAAAIYCRAALEVSLRAMCRMGGVEFDAGDSINKMAQRLSDATLLGPDEWKAIQRWAPFANAAAYQKVNQYRAEQVEQMISWLEKFSGRSA